MRERLTAFGLKCRDFRARYNLVMADQAKGLNVSVAYISAIELGKRPIPPDYPRELSYWLSLPSEDSKLLSELAIGSQQIVRLRPKNTEQAKLAHDLAEGFGDLPKEGVELLRKSLAISRSKKHSHIDVRKRAMLVGAIFNADQRLTFDVLRIVENKLHLVDQDFFLKIESEEAGQTTLHSRSNRKKVYNITSSPWFYNEADHQTSLSRFKLAHEIAHWILHPNENHTYAKLPGTNRHASRRHLQAELEADIFAREFLLPIAVVDCFESAEALAKAANVPNWVAQKRFRELRELTAHERYTLRLYAKSIKDLCTTSKVSADLSRTLFGEIVTVSDVVRKEPSRPPRRRGQRKAWHSDLFDHADLHEQFKTRSADWFQKYGYRG